MVLIRFVLYFQNSISGFTVGFTNTEKYIKDTLWTIFLDLPLEIVSGTTEIDMEISMSIGANTTAKPNVGKYGFYS